MNSVSIERETNIRIYDNVVPKSYCQQLVSALLNCPQAASVGTEDPLGRRARRLYVDEVRIQSFDREQRAQWLSVVSQLQEAVTPVLQRFLVEFKYLADKPLCFPGYTFIEYLRNRGHRALGSDVCEEHPRSVFSLVLFLNDVTAGGELEFPTQELRVPARAGRLVIAPPFWTHARRSSPPLSADQYLVEHCAEFYRTPTP